MIWLGALCALLGVLVGDRAVRYWYRAGSIYCRRCGEYGCVHQTVPARTPS